MRMNDSSPLPILPDGWERPSGYTHGWKVPEGRSILFVAGQVGWDVNGQFASESFAEQFGQALANCVAVVSKAGGSAQHIVRLTVFCLDRDQYLAQREELGKIWRSTMGSHYPAMTVVQVSSLMEDKALVEIEATAALPAVTE